MDKRATCRKILRKTALSVLAASILMTGTVPRGAGGEETPNVLSDGRSRKRNTAGQGENRCDGNVRVRDWSIPATGWK